jgi:phosphohistidine phosphatase SixA
MKSITLMRHGDAPFDDDMERPLSLLGQNEASNVGKQLQNYWDECSGHLAPDYVLCSWTSRTKDTFSEVKACCHYLQNVEVRSMMQLEFASPQQVLDMITQIDDRLNSLMILGHDTYLSTIVKVLSTKISMQEFPNLNRSFTHAQCAIIQHDDLSKWSDLKPQSFEIKANFRPQI